MGLGGITAGLALGGWIMNATKHDRTAITMSRSNHHAVHGIQEV